MKVWYKLEDVFYFRHAYEPAVYVSLYRKKFFRTKSIVMLIPKTDEEKFKADPLAYIRNQIAEKKAELTVLQTDLREAELVPSHERQRNILGESKVEELVRKIYVKAQDIEFMEYWEQAYTKQLKLAL